MNEYLFEGLSSERLIIEAERFSSQIYSNDEEPRITHEYLAIEVADKDELEQELKTWDAATLSWVLDLYTTKEQREKLTQGGWDLHNANDLAELFADDYKEFGFTETED